MSQDRWQRVKDVFQAALERPPAARAAFVRETCGEDEALRREVDTLLDARSEAGAFLSGGAVGFDSGVPDEGYAEGRLIGPYRVLGEVGRGGMGRVYRAVRDDDVFRKVVAIKLVHAAASEHLRERLQKERRILARLQHPNIATILDGGTTEDGQPYLVMEYVEGEPMDRWCEARGARTRERLEMFQAVCGAVQYAHQNLVVHRDLKPQNILVTKEGSPKLLDFGIAKLLAEGTTTESAPTATLLPMMTPEYASPEQVRGESITTLTDVYSLGVVLYELLTSRRPYAVNTGSLQEIVRAVCETEPLPPSAAVHATEGRAVTPRGIAPSELRGDLDTIVLKALRKEPSRRYASAQDLAEDVRRHLAGLPVRARKDTLGYRAGKFVARNRLVVAATLLLFGSLAAGLAATARQARIAEVNRARAERRFGDVRKLANSFLFEFHDAIKDLPGSTKARELVVKRALEYLDSLAGEASADPALQRELADAYEKVGDVQGLPYVESLGDSEGALRSFEHSLAIRRSLLSPADPAVQLEACRAGTRVGRVLLRRGNSSEALVRLQEALPWCEASWRGRPVGEAAQERLLTRLFVADALRRDGRQAQAAEGYRGVLEVGRELMRTDPTVRRYVASTYDRLGQTLGELGDRQGSLKARRDFVGFAEDIVREDPSVPRYRRNLGVAHENLAVELGDQNALKEALTEAGKAVVIYEALRGADRANVQGAIDLASGQVLRGEILLALGGETRLSPVFEEATRLAEEALASDPDATQPRAIAARALAGIAHVHGRGGEHGPAVQALSRAIAHRERILAQDPNYEDNRSALEALKRELTELRPSLPR